jgi:SAM-dependent methyltransferase
MSLVLDAMAPTLAAAHVVLDIAPTPTLAAILRREVGGLYLTCDVDPAADGRRVMLQADLTRLPLPDGVADVLICMQVLEHIPDDHAAMSEIARVLAPGGLAFVNVPFRAGTMTDEDPTADAAERTRRFGQADHVRYYGDDFDDRLTAAGLGFAKVTSIELCGADLVSQLGLSAAETFWFVWRDATRTPPGLPRLDTLRAFAAIAAGTTASLRSAVTPWLRVRMPPRALQFIRRVRQRGVG